MTEAVKPQEMVVLLRPPTPSPEAPPPSPSTVPWSAVQPPVPGMAGGATLFSPPIPAAVAAPAVADDQPFAAQPPPRSEQHDDSDDDLPVGLIGWCLGLLDDLPYWLGSMVVHLVLALLLSMFARPLVDRQVAQPFLFAPLEEEEQDPAGGLANFEIVPPMEIMHPSVPIKPPESPPAKVPINPPPVDGSPDATADRGPLAAEVERDSRRLLLGSDPDGPAMRIELSGIGPGPASHGDLTIALGGVPRGDSLSGRGPARRGELVASAGGSPASERAVAGALAWLAEHQLPDGSWSFDHTQAPTCQGKCGNRGHAAEARNGATAIALLPFLGAGQTHREGKYTQTVDRGLQYLLGHLKTSEDFKALRRGRKAAGLENVPLGPSFLEREGRMYSHGLASIALSEAYAMTHDKQLEEPVRQVIEFICFAQDPKGGGWRYVPQERGDTSMVGWQLMALKSGHMAGLPIPLETTRRAMYYLDGVQCNDGANYGYQHPNPGEATTAIGLLCRMLLGWNRDNPALKKGVEWLSEHGPSPGNMYYNYYATQVMRHWGGPLWRKWNNVMRDQLVDAQRHEGHEAGSWFFSGNDHGVGPGGRLYFTALAAMTLEIYYRFLPLYRSKSTADLGAE